jgi:hypothetical protein
MAFLVWLAGFERLTVENVAAVITRVRRTRLDRQSRSPDKIEHEGG